MLAQRAIELSSWDFGNSGTRFKLFGTPGTPCTPQEKTADAAQVNKHAALSAIVALYIPWGEVDDDDEFGSLTHVDPTVRQRAIDHHFEWSDDLSALHVFPKHRRTISEADNAPPVGVTLPWFETLSHFRVDSEPSGGDGIRTEYFVPIAHASAALGAVRS